ncbi:glutamate racemase [bacterium]|nr:glutamate racemase [bacterium]
MQRRLIGVFDSGVGGLSVARHIDRDLPNTSFIYFGDTYYVPYGEREPQEVVRLIDKICHHLLESKAEALVMACNTSSALAYDHVKAWSPVPVIGIIEEAAQAALQASRHGRIGVLANMLTASSGAYERACAKHKDESAHKSAEVFPVGCPKLVPLIEKGQVSGAEAEAALREYWQPLLNNGVDTVIFGCTHYPFLRPLLEKIAGPDIAIIDPAYYVAEHLKRLGFEAENEGEGCYEPAERIYQVSGDADKFAQTAEILLGYKIGRVDHINL